MLGVSIDPDYVAMREASDRGKAKARPARRALEAAEEEAARRIPELEHPDFEFVAGYTSWGFPYGTPRKTQTEEAGWLVPDDVPF